MNRSFRMLSTTLLLTSSCSGTNLRDHLVEVQHITFRLPTTHLPMPTIRYLYGSGICINPECSVVVTAGHIQMLIGKATLGVSGAQTDKVLSLAQSMDSGKVDIRADGKTSVITSKAANGYHFKTGQRSGRPGLRLFYPAASCGGKSVLVRQLRGPHLST